VLTTVAAFLYQGFQAFTKKHSPDWMIAVVWAVLVGLSISVLIETVKRFQKAAAKEDNGRLRFIRRYLC